VTNEHIEHLKMIQGIISRLANNSFSYKGWSITLVSALLLLAAKDSEPLYALVGLVPVLFFWWLDAYYLCQERLFRQLFDEVRKKARAPNPDPPDFSMKISAPAPGASDSKRYTVKGVAFSPTVRNLYLPLFGAVILVALIVWLVGKCHDGI
jgi:hypothetical protein